MWLCMCLRVFPVLRGDDDGDVLRADCTTVTTSMGATATDGGTQRINTVVGTATTEETWEVPLRAALFLPADC
jgi:hypothetical protein